MVSSSSSLRFKSIPPPVRLFLIRALIFFIIWQTIYQFGLKPNRYLDHHVTRITAIATAYIITKTYKSTSVVSEPPKDIISVNGVKIIGIADGCNGLELFVLYLAFLTCMPSTIARKFIFATFGILAIFGLNVLRCCSIAWLNINHPKYVDFAHHYAFTAIIYGFIFYMLTLFSKNILSKRNSESIAGT